MEAKLTRLTHKIAVQLFLVAESYTIAVLAPGGQSRNFGIHPHIFKDTGNTLHLISTINVAIKYVCVRARVCFSDFCCCYL